MGFVVAVAAVLSYQKTPAKCLQRPAGIGVDEREAVSEKRERECMWVARGLGGVDEAVCGGLRPRSTLAALHAHNDAYRRLSRS